MLDVLKERELVILERCKLFLQSEQEFQLRKPENLGQGESSEKWGKEWMPECTFPNDDRWPFSL